MTISSNHKRLAFIILASVISCFMLYVIERLLLANYETKTISKILFFTLIPIIYWKWLKSTSEKKEKKSNLRLSILLSLAVFGIIWLGYWGFGSLVDFSSIQNELNLSSGEYLLRGIYIILGNSFLEEFFFRGFIFLNLSEIGFQKTAYIFSSALFSIYHMAMFQSWFSFGIMLLILTALFVVGFVFNYLCSRVSSFTGSWIVHASADLAIIWIGWVAFF